MEVIFGLLLALACVWWLRKTWRARRFEKLRSGQWRMWELLSTSEKVELLFATKALRLRDAKNSMDAARMKKGDRPDVRAIVEDFAFDDLHKAIAECPDFRNFDRSELDRAWATHISEYWSAMRYTGDYDLGWAEAELAFLTSNRRRLSREMTQWLPKAVDERVGDGKAQKHKEIFPCGFVSSVDEHISASLIHGCRPRRVRI